MPFLVLEWSARASDNPILPPPSAVVRSLFFLAVSGDLSRHLAASLGVIVWGFGMAAATGFIMALLLHSLPSLSRPLIPLADSVRSVSAIAMMPAVIVAVGIGALAKAIVIFWTAWPSVLINTMHGLEGVDRDIRGAALIDGCDRWRILRVIVPVAAPTIAAGLRLAVGGAWISLVAAEMLGADSGLGFLVLTKSQAFDFPGMWAAITAIALTGLAMNSLLNLVTRRFDS